MRKEDSLDSRLGRVNVKQMIRSRHLLQRVGMDKIQASIVEGWGSIRKSQASIEEGWVQKMECIVI